MSELKPCPFCGMNGEAKYAVDYGGRTIFQCQWCGASHHSFDDWNNRPIEDELRARIAELEAHIAALEEAADIEEWDDFPNFPELPEVK